MIKSLVKLFLEVLPINEKRKDDIKKSLKEAYNKALGKKTDIYDRNKTGKMSSAIYGNVSVVIPNYNYARYIIERIDSILNQTYPIYELIILDDCSSDNSVQVIKEKIAELEGAIDVKLIENKENSGSVFAQWKKAFLEARGEYIWIAEADDSCSPLFLETVMRGFNDKEVVISYCESLTMDENNTILMGNLRPWIDIFNSGKWNDDYTNDGIEEITQSLCINNTIANVSSVVFKNGNYLEIIEEAKQFKLAGDWYVYMRILEQGKIAYCSQSLNYHRMQQQGLTLSTTHEKEFREIVKMQDYALEHYNIPEDVKAKVLERRERERIRFGL